MKASIVIPTTGDRSALVSLAIGSVKLQTLKAWEVLIIGDGVDDPSRVNYLKMQTDDPRIRFFDFPKHDRRGEPNRHEVIARHAKGEIISYLCDRDLMLPNHLALHYHILQNQDFSTSLAYQIHVDQKIRLGRSPAHRDNIKSMPPDQKGLFPLSTVCHRLDYYRKLPFGWRTTPIDTATDVYMWRQFLDQENCRAWASPDPTILFFKRGNHPGWSVAERLPEMTRWSETIQKQEGIAGIHQEAATMLIQECNTLYQAVRSQNRRLKSFLLVRGLTPIEAIRNIIRKCSYPKKKSSS
jgi:glycosyltransferase involved in cell wall biosynthesis